MIEDVGWIIQKRRMELHIGTKELAHKAGMNVQTLRLIERGAQTPKWGTALRLLRLLDLSIEINHNKG